MWAETRNRFDRQKKEAIAAPLRIVRAAVMVPDI